MLPLEIHGRGHAETKTITLEQLKRVRLTGFKGKYP